MIFDCKNTKTVVFKLKLFSKFQNLYKNHKNV